MGWRDDEDDSMAAQSGDLGVYGEDEGGGDGRDGGVWYVFELDWFCVEGVTVFFATMFDRRKMKRREREIHARDKA